jgi:hypothetical protein
MGKAEKATGKLNCSISIFSFFLPCKTNNFIPTEE